MKTLKIYMILVATMFVTACQDYLDIVPDNVPTIDYAFHMRSSAERYLATCYSYLPDHAHINNNSGFNSSDEVWYFFPERDINLSIFNIAKGLQNSSNPLVNYWNGTNQGKPLFQAIRDCNIFLENISKVVNMEDYERERWKAEVTFLKAYYHFYLLRMYGPIPLIRENLPLESSPDDVKIYREPVNECFDYIVQLLNEAAANESLPDIVLGNETTELGRITRAIVLAFKAKVLVTAASPLFNGGNNFFNVTDSRGVQLFNQEPDPQKWVAAVEACREAIELCDNLGYKLYEFPPVFSYTVNDTIQRQLNIRTAITERENNTEVIWPNTVYRAGAVQRFFVPKIVVGDAGASGVRPKGMVAPTLKMVNMFYTDNGLPIEFDNEWSTVDEYALREAGEADRFYIKKGEQTVQMHFDREPRFYANLGFDRGIWFGNAANNYNVTLEDSGAGSLLFVRGRAGELSARQEAANYSITGYTVKKLVDIRTTQTPQIQSGDIYTYNWPEIRISDLYLLYAEALNEVHGYTDETTKWINLVRERAGIPSVEDAWDDFSTRPGYYTDKANLREIIHRERTIELAFEGSRSWDLKRWLKAHQSGELNAPVYGWDITQKDPQAYYRQVLLFNQRFAMRDYLWPIRISELQVNTNLVQNPGW